MNARARLNSDGAKPPQAAPPAGWLRRKLPFLAGVLLDFRQTTIVCAAVAALALYAIVYIGALAGGDGLTTSYGKVVGGDFIVFWSVADAALEGNAAAIYAPDVMEARLLEAFPGPNGYPGMSWQYPPTMLLLIAPLGALSYTPALLVWSLATIAVFIAALAGLWRNGAAILIVFASASAFQALITGQTGFLTAALLGTAAGWADRRPLLAGLAAGLLTVKPQFGLLIPFAFAAAGCWRAFAVAALTGAGLMAASLAVFGPEAWIAFYDALANHGERMGEAAFPFNKLITVYGLMVLLGAPTGFAAAMHTGAMLGLIAFIVIVWRQTDEWDLRAIALTAAAPLATPYAFYYELTLFAPALILLTQRGLHHGWLKGERIALAVLWAAPIALPATPIGPLLSIGAFALCTRRIMYETGQVGRRAFMAAARVPSSR